MQDFIDEFGLDSFPHLNDADERLFARFGVPFQPAWVFIDSKGDAARVLGSVPGGPTSPGSSRTSRPTVCPRRPVHRACQTPSLPSVQRWTEAR